MSFSDKGAKKLKLPTELKAEQNHQHFKFELKKSQLFQSSASSKATVARKNLLFKDRNLEWLQT